MSGPYKVVTRHALPRDMASLVVHAYSATPPQQTLGLGGGSITISLGAILREAIEREIAATRRTSLDDARAQLDQLGRVEHLLNLYLDLDHRTAVVHGTWTFTNRDTALLFKLSRA